MLYEQGFPFISSYFAIFQYLIKCPLVLCHGTRWTETSWSSCLGPFIICYDFLMSPLIYVSHKVICAGITDCSTGVADAASAREHQKPPIVISLQKICSQGHRPIRQAWLKATVAWAYHSVPSPSPPSLARTLPPLPSPLLSSPQNPPSPDRRSLPVASLGWTSSFFLSQLPWTDSWFLTNCAVEVSWPGSQGSCLNPSLQRDLDKSG